jgi:hypothetical protein
VCQPLRLVCGLGRCGTTCHEDERASAPGPSRLIHLCLPIHVRGPVTPLQQAAYDAQLAAALPSCELGHALLIPNGGLITAAQCATFILAIQTADWFTAAFTGHTLPIQIVGGCGISYADSSRHLVGIGDMDRHEARTCELACLHELAHVVTQDTRPKQPLTEVTSSEGESRGHHHAWRANFVFIVRMTIGKSAASRLRHEFNEWGLHTQ